MSTYLRKKEAVKGELVAYRWLVENKESIFLELGIDLDCEVYFILLIGEVAEADIKSLTSNFLQQKAGIDIVIGKFTSENVFESQLTIDVKSASDVYFEMFGPGRSEYERAINKETGELEIIKSSRLFSVDDLQMNYHRPDEIKYFHISGGDQEKMNNNHCQAYIFVSKKELKILGGKNPIVFSDDIVQALKLGYLKGEEYVPWHREEEGKSKRIPNSKNATFGNRQDMKFANTNKFYTEIQEYKDSIIKQSIESCSPTGEKNKLNFSIEKRTAIIPIEARQGNKKITVNIPLTNRPFLIVADEEGHEIDSVRISDVK